MKYTQKIFLRIFLFIILTILTQIGGIAYLLSLWINKKWKVIFMFKPILVFVMIYLVFTFIMTPLLAPYFGREKVKNSKIINPANYMTILLNRNYVCPEMNNLLTHVAEDLNGTDVTINYLDANFPFINKFPLLPHLSHNDGKKIDLSLIYETQKGTITSKQKTRSGYGAFESPNLNEYNQIRKCLKDGYFQYDYPKYLTLGKINTDLVFSERGTKTLIESILKQANLGKLFIEPHLRQRLNLNNPKVRYHGCRAVRHDDHIHIQLK
ncbi:hypothetical protein GWA97_06125 [Flavobacterium sp. LaA7.5]|nr:hypothetical protein [Flavobacterium salilacus subsp. altitudinum]